MHAVNLWSTVIWGFLSHFQAKAGSLYTAFCRVFSGEQTLKYPPWEASDIPLLQDEPITGQKLLKSTSGDAQRGATARPPATALAAIQLLFQRGALNQVLSLPILFSSIMYTYSVSSPTVSTLLDLEATAEKLKSKGSTEHRHY